MRTETKTSRFLEEAEKAKFWDFVRKHDLSLGLVADKVNITYVYLSMVLNGKRAFTKKLEKKLSDIGFNL